MQLDVRLPMGALFSILGALVCGYGLAKSYFIDVRWGGAMLLFGLFCLCLTWFAARRARNASVEPEVVARSRKD